MCILSCYLLKGPGSTFKTWNKMQNRHVFFFLIVVVIPSGLKLSVKNGQGGVGVGGFYLTEKICYLSTVPAKKWKFTKNSTSNFCLTVTSQNIKLYLLQKADRSSMNVRRLRILCVEIHKIITNLLSDFKKKNFALKETRQQIKFGDSSI